ncbi:MAG: nucleotidyl transferase AbiEii/AbiGii toxin family protein, partial [Armatimonadetes bacterium]|nr:nucleotidyl transferase AbiEii/AbiGii toxin family protein [Armatimonadota bacterium]
MNRQSGDISASVRQKLLNISRAKHQEHQLTLTQYAIERLLFRLSVSQHKEQFVLKGAVLFSIWSEQRRRPTQDVDMLGWGDASISRLDQEFRVVCGLDVEDDGLSFLADT